jgi:hypothetical protein
MLETELNAKIKIMAVWTSLLTKISEEIKKYVGINKKWKLQIWRRKKSLTNDRKRRGKNRRISCCLENTFKIWMPNLPVKKTNFCGVKKKKREHLKRKWKWDNC